MRIKTYAKGGYIDGGFTSGGGTMTGPLFLAGNPVKDLEAAPKQYADAKLTAFDAERFTSGTLQVGRLPAFSGDVVSNTGSNSILLANIGISSGVYSKVTVNAKGLVTAGGGLAESDIPSLDWSKFSVGRPSSISGYGITDALTKAGGTVSGSLTLSADPTATFHAATKQYVDNIVGASSALRSGDIVTKMTSTTPTGFLRCNGGEVSKTTYAALFAVIGEGYLVKADMDYTSYSTIGAGQPWTQQYDFKNTTATTLSGWGAAGSTSVTLTQSQAIITKNRIYLLGGGPNGSFTSNVYTAVINADGTFGGWSIAGNLPGIRWGSSAIITKNRVFVIGGADGSSTPQDSVYTAPINTDGTLGTWTTSTSLPTPVYRTHVVVTKNRVYVLGGTDQSYSVSNKVYVASINADGTLGAWSTGSPLSRGLSLSQLIVTKNRVYLCGGAYSGGQTAEIHSAPINADGTLGTWAQSGSLPAIVFNGKAVTTKNRAFIIKSNTQYSAPINADGTLGTWTQGADLPVSQNEFEVVVIKNKVYLLGNYNISSSAYSATVYTANLPSDSSVSDFSAFYNGTINKFNGSDLSGSIVVADNYVEVGDNIQPGGGKPWTDQYTFNKTTTQLGTFAPVAGVGAPVAQESPHLVVTKNKVYYVGGFAQSNLNTTIYSANINTDGTITAFTTTGMSIPNGIVSCTLIVVKGRVYIFGPMFQDVNTSINRILSSAIDANGTLTGWVTHGNFPTTAASYPVVFTTAGDRVYVMTGNACYTTTLDSFGLVQSWSLAGSIPFNTSRASCFTTKNRVYVIAPETGTNRVFTASINSDGTVGAWTTANNLPSYFESKCPVVTANRVYLIAGRDSVGNSVTTDYYADINADGTIGNWTAINLTGSNPRGAAMGFATHSKYYIMNGWQNSVGPSDWIQVADFSGGLSDYSAYYNGTIQPVGNSVFKLPDLTSYDLPGTYSYIKT